MSAHSDAEVADTAVREAIDLRRLPWVRPLVRAQVEDFGSVAPLFVAGNPADPAAWRSTITRVQQAPRDRTTLASIVGRQLADRDAPVAARSAAASLAEPSTVAIVTGQQAGIYGGPLYTLLKAATAIQLARRVKAEHGVTTVPVFWVDSDDHDWQEIRSATVFDSELAPRTLSLGEISGAGVQPVGTLVLDDAVNRLNAELQASLPTTEFTADLMSSLQRHYRSGVRLASAFASWIEELLGRHGLVVFDSWDSSARTLVADLFAHELADPGRTSRLAREAGERMNSLGHRPQVEPADDNVALFHVDAHGRQPIKRRGDELVIGSIAQPAEAVRREAREHPERFSPNVLLRPLVQDRMFPTICYVAGPSELAYQAQLAGVYRDFKVEPPLLFSRASATLLDAAAVKFLERHQFPLESLQPQDESALNQLLEHQLPKSIETTMADLERVMAERTKALEGPVATVDPTLVGAVDTTLKKLRDTVNTLHSKIIQASKRKDETLRRQFLRTRALAFPGGAPQERAITLVSFVNRYGPNIGARLLETLPLDTSKHYVMTL